MEIGRRLGLAVSEFRGEIIKSRLFLSTKYKQGDYDKYLQTYDDFEPDSGLVKLLLVGREYINVSYGMPFFGSVARFREDLDVIKTSGGLLGDISTRDFMFNLLSPNPEWREVFPGEVGAF